MPSLGREAGDVALKFGEAGLGWLSANGAGFGCTHRTPLRHLLLWLVPDVGNRRSLGFPRSRVYFHRHVIGRQSLEASPSNDKIIKGLLSLPGLEPTTSPPEAPVFSPIVAAKDPATRGQFKWTGVSAFPLGWVR
ncbi:hypothetical protein CORC01_12909 [Colletotrichum orchidophilum]|uniref:Uncharacterized protein n=1 Tax=Colletotrichum orchidophilum TaxID=1209926 RepID=A0A1G4ARY0_9PEZI|nr:uncharacterized protein CORC01_12909 [Colletotrichum orchidophilum]OHE91782.1 hypothetical protein CORC01_12909 [Colletotrichum orchidophilum]